MVYDEQEVMSGPWNSAISGDRQRYFTRAQSFQLQQYLLSLSSC